MKETLLTAATRFKYHRPVYPGETEQLKPIPYLRLPFNQSDLAHWQIRPSQPGIGRRVEYTISEGWWYSAETKKLIPYMHTAVDYRLPYGFPVAAPCDGISMSSYYSFPFKDKRGNPHTNSKGEKSHFGIGYFVQIYNPAQKRIVQLGHLSDIASEIPFSIPQKADGKWNPTNNTATPEQMLLDKEHFRFVQTGEIIGYVGYSGLTYGEDYKEGCDRPFRINPDEIGTINIPHIHMDESRRNIITGKKDWRRDPYDIYKTSPYYPSHSNDIDIGPNPLFLTDENNRPKFADST